jgi:hypothetical protein
LLLLSEHPCFPSAGSRSGSFITSLVCELRSHILVSLGGFGFLKNLKKDDPTPADSPVSDRKCSHGACLSPLGAKSANFALGEIAARKGIAILCIERVIALARRRQVAPGAHRLMSPELWRQGRPTEALLRFVSLII